MSVSEKLLRFLKPAERVSVSVLLLLCLSAGGARADITVRSISDEMFTSSRAFRELKVVYELKDPVRIKGRAEPITQVTKATWYQKKLGGVRDPNKLMRRWGYDIFRIDPQSGESVWLGQYLASFNGKNTIRLDKRPTATKPARGTIRPGYQAADFPLVYRSPNKQIWYYGSTHLTELLTQDPNNFKVEDTAAPVGDLQTIMLTGDHFEGKLTIKSWVCPERSFLPVKFQAIRNEDQRILSEQVLSKFVELPGGLWYPRQIRTGPADPNYASVYTITEISTEPIPDKLFSPNFPPNTHVVDYVNKVSYTTTE